MTREEVLLEALAASQQREREMAERLLDMEERMEGFEPDPPDEHPKWLAQICDKHGIELGEFVPIEVKVEKRISAPTEVQITLRKRKRVLLRPLPPQIVQMAAAYGTSTRNASEAFAKLVAAMNAPGNTFKLDPKDITHPGGKT